MIASRKRKIASALGAFFAVSLLMSGCSDSPEKEPEPEQSLESVDGETAAPKIDFAKVRGYDLTKLPDQTDPDATAKFVTGVRLGYDPVVEASDETNVMQYLANNRLITKGFDIDQTVFNGIEAEMTAYDGYFNVEKITKAEDDPVKDTKTDATRQFTVDVKATGKTEASDGGADSDKIWNDGTWDGGTFTYVAYVHLVKIDGEWFVNDMRISE